jgi:hypothetical protein
VTYLEAIASEFLRAEEKEWRRARETGEPERHASENEELVAEVRLLVQQMSKSHGPQFSEERNITNVSLRSRGSSRRRLVFLFDFLSGQDTEPRSGKIEVLPIFHTELETKAHLACTVDELKHVHEFFYHRLTSDVI